MNYFRIYKYSFILNVILKDHYFISIQYCLMLQLQLLQISLIYINKLHATSLYCDHMLLHALGHVLLVTIILFSKILVTKFTSIVCNA